MSSILTNTSAMVALQTLSNVNKNLTQVQGNISTGKKVANAKDNSAVWAISKVMESDVAGFKGISESLGLGESTVAVARSASETVNDLLTQMKEKIVAAQEENVDRDKIQADIDALADSIGATVSAAQFNGLNLLSNKEAEAGSGTVNVLGSLDRSSSGVTVGQIAVTKEDLGTEASSVSGTAIAAASNNLTGAADLDCHGADGRRYASDHLRDHRRCLGRGRLLDRAQRRCGQLRHRCEHLGRQRHQVCRAGWGHDHRRGRRPGEGIQQATLPKPWAMTVRRLPRPSTPPPA